MRSILTLILAIAVCDGKADAISLIKIGDSWGIFRGHTEPSIPIEAWRQVEFDDSLWSFGPSGFRGGFNASTETTRLLDYGIGYQTVFFRRAFVVDSVAEITWLILRLDYSHGFVAYLNGFEVARSGVPGQTGETVPLATLAEPRSSGNPEDIDISDSISLLRDGENVLAIQVHASTTTGPSMALVPELMANFTRGPFLQSTTQSSTIINWKTPTPATTEVRYGRTPDLGMVNIDTAEAIDHSITLDGLSDDTKYFYQTISSTGSKTARSPVLSFRTLKDSGRISFAVLGDSGRSTVFQHRVARQIQLSAPDLVLHTGDIIYPHFQPNWVDTRCLSVYGPHMRSVPYFFAVGNHDIDLDIQHFQDAFYLPTNDTPPEVHSSEGTAPEFYYSFDHGPAHFVVLFAPFFTQYVIESNNPQHQWLQADLAASTKSWNFLFLHHTVFSSSVHRNDDYNRNLVTDNVDLQSLLIPLAKAYGVHMIFTGHDHVYERFNPVEGAFGITTAGGGGGLYSFLQLDPNSSQFHRKNHFVKVTADEQALELQAIDEFGIQFDQMWVRRTPTPAQTYTAAWNKPTIEIEAPNDLDGNLVGQKFDFKGPRIPAKTGRFSNLGRLVVNNDASTLYLGLEECMVRPNQLIYLFLEGSEVGGVQTMAGLGDGVSPAELQAAEGLDQLEHLEFKNFSPTIACVVGDEFGDQQSRMFQRPNLPLAVGQGVFQLNENLDDVPGIRLQQFNRSPQTLIVPGEQNANYVEMAIPLESLGETSPGSNLKIAAIVGSIVTDPTTGQPTVSLDDGYLGVTLTGGGLEATIIEPVDVLLAADPDADGDGIPLEVELRLGTDPNHHDSDRDGLPDGWEVENSFSPLTATGVDGANADPDGDNFTNEAEYLAGTDPRSRESLLDISSIQRNDSHLSIAWRSVPGKKYLIEAASRPNGPYQTLQDLETAIEANAEDHQLIFQLELPDLDTATLYFRVRLAP